MTTFKLPAMKRPLAKSIGCPFCNVIEKLHQISTINRYSIEDEAIASGYLHGILDKRFIDVLNNMCDFHLNLVQAYAAGAAEGFDISYDEFSDYLEEADEEKAANK